MATTVVVVVHLIEPNDTETPNANPLRDRPIWLEVRCVQHIDKGRGNDRHPGLGNS